MKLKFRGVCIKTGNMVYGGGIDTERDTPMIINQGVRTPVFVETVGRFSGLKCKAGIDVYEGDIVHQYCEWSGGYDSDEYGEYKTTGVVRIYPSKGVVITRAKRIDLTDCDPELVKTWDLNLRACRSVVVGNIYENPELLEN